MMELLVAYTRLGLGNGDHMGRIAVLYTLAYDIARSPALLSSAIH